MRRGHRPESRLAAGRRSLGRVQTACSTSVAGPAEPCVQGTEHTCGKIIVGRAVGPCLSWRPWTSCTLSCIDYHLINGAGSVRRCRVTLASEFFALKLCGCTDSGFFDSPLCAVVWPPISASEIRTGSTAQHLVFPYSSIRRTQKPAGEPGGGRECKKSSSERLRGESTRTDLSTRLLFGVPNSTPSESISPPLSPPNYPPPCPRTFLQTTPLFPPHPDPLLSFSVSGSIVGDVDDEQKPLRQRQRLTLGQGREAECARQNVFVS
jgi:hypothetical protein